MAARLMMLRGHLAADPLTQMKRGLAEMYQLQSSHMSGGLG